MKTAKIVALGVASLLTTGVLAASTSANGAAVVQSAPEVNPADFTNPQANPYFPLRPGTVTRYRGSDSGEQFRERVTITDRKKVIAGVRTTVVLDVSRRVDGSLAERTHDWYAGDNDGNVWYFGEATATYDEQGNVESREGSWMTGVHGAVAGVIMPADPKPTDAYRQEFFAGHAEDQGWIVARNATVKVPYGKFHKVVRGFEWTRLEPRVVSLKFYARGVGIIRETDVAGGDELFELVGVSHN